MLFLKQHYQYILIILFNLLIFSVNIIFLSSLNNKIVNDDLLTPQKTFDFKNSDNFIISLSKIKFKDISNYLNNKYIINYNFFKNKKKLSIKMNKRKKLNLHVIDSFNNEYHKKWIKKKLGNKFIINFDNNNPDYLIYNSFGKRHLNSQYKDAIKIAIYTENVIPDLFEADYALGHYHINYLDRYFKCSIFLWRKYKEIKNIRENVLKAPMRKKFCAAVISNSKRSDRFRLKFINLLNNYKKIDMGGKYNNNIGGRVLNKTKFLNSYKFSIAMENSNGDGYISEKIINSFMSGTIPIYYGDYMIDEFINPKSYILIKGEKDIKKKIEYIKKIDNNDEMYRKILKEDVIIEENFASKIDSELKEFLIHIFDQDKNKAYRAINEN